MGIINDFQGGYRDGKAGKYTAITIILLIAVVLYFFQKWTGIPVFDWIMSALEWLGDFIWGLIGKLLDLISKSL